MTATDRSDLLATFDQCAAELLPQRFSSADATKAMHFMIGQVRTQLADGITDFGAYDAHAV